MTRSEPRLAHGQEILSLILCSDTVGWVLHQLESAMDQLGLLSYLPKPASCGINADVTEEYVPYLGPTWCDDLCVPRYPTRS